MTKVIDLRGLGTSKGLDWWGTRGVTIGIKNKNKTKRQKTQKQTNHCAGPVGTRLLTPCCSLKKRRKNGNHFLNEKQAGEEKGKKEISGAPPHLPPLKKKTARKRTKGLVTLKKKPNKEPWTGGELTTIGTMTTVTIPSGKRR